MSEKAEGCSGAMIISGITERVLVREGVEFRGTVKSWVSKDTIEATQLALFFVGQFASHVLESAISSVETYYGKEVAREVRRAVEAAREKFKKYQ